MSTNSDPDTTTKPFILTIFGPTNLVARRAFYTLPEDWRVEIDKMLEEVEAPSYEFFERVDHLDTPTDDVLDLVVLLRIVKADTFLSYEGGYEGLNFRVLTRKEFDEAQERRENDEKPGGGKRRKKAAEAGDWIQKGSV